MENVNTVAEALVWLARKGVAVHIDNGLDSNGMVIRLIAVSQVDGRKYRSDCALSPRQIEAANPLDALLLTRIQFCWRKLEEALPQEPDYAAVEKDPTS